MAKTPQKGGGMEEILRNYFLRAGYYVARGVPYNYRGFGVTDIDLWLYGRNSSVSREIAIVDIKNKRTPQAIERIFWVKGLQAAMHASNALVATTDKRQEVKEFGKELGVLVLDGNFISRLSRHQATWTERLTEEDFFGLLEEYKFGKIGGDWKGRYIDSKTLLSRGLSFDSCNTWLEHGRYFAEQVFVNPSQRELAYRLCFLVASYIAVAIDFLLRDMSFGEKSETEKKLREGFAYGSRGESGVNSIINASLALVEQFADNGTAVSNQVRSNFAAEANRLPANILSEYFSKTEVGKSLLSTAIELEKLSMNNVFASHSSASIDTRSLLGCLLDFWQLDRKQFSQEGA